MIVRAAPKSPLAGVADAAWERLVRALEVQGTGDVSASGGLGAFDLRPRRLVELGLATGLRHVRVGRAYMHKCDLAPALADVLRDPLLQYKVLSLSLTRYDEEMRSGAVVRPESLSRAGALAVLHRGGRGALAGALFPRTKALVARVDAEDEEATMSSDRISREVAFNLAARRRRGDGDCPYVVRASNKDGSPSRSALTRNDLLLNTFKDLTKAFDRRDALERLNPHWKFVVTCTVGDQVEVVESR